MRQIIRYTPQSLRASLAPAVETLTAAAVRYLEPRTVPRLLSLLIGPGIEPLTGGRFEHRGNGLVRIRLDTGNRDGAIDNLAHELGHLLIDAASQPPTRSDGWLLLNEYAAERIGYQLIQEVGLFDLDTAADKLERELIEIQFLWRVSVFYAGKVAPTRADALNRAKATDRFLTHFIYMCAAIDALPIAHEESIWTRDLPDSVAQALMGFIAPADQHFPATLAPGELRTYMDKVAKVLNRSLPNLMKPRNFGDLVTRPGSTPTRVLQFSRPVGELFEGAG